MELKFTENIKAPSNEPKDMEISVVIDVIENGKTKFAGARAKGKYLAGVRGINPQEDDETNFIVKLAQETGMSWPMTSGIFTLKWKGDAWLDDREEDPKKHCVRIKGTDFELIKTHELYKKAK